MGFFDVADIWFGWEAGSAGFGRTLAQCGISPGPYPALPLLAPSTVRAAASLSVDGGMQPLHSLLPVYPETIAARGGWVMGNAVNFRSLNLELFEKVERFSVDLYGAVQDGFLPQRERVVQEALSEQ